MVTLKTLVEFLTKTAPPENYEERAFHLIERLTSDNDLTRRTAEIVLARIGYEWESFYEEEFVIAVLGELTRRELISAIPEVERVVIRGGRTEARKRVAESAKRCLTVLTSRHNEVLAKQQLLRPSEPETETLLRPAVTVPSASPNELLRPVKKNSGG